MDHFRPINGVLAAENISLERVADTVGTPAYVYSAATMRRHVRVLSEAFQEVPHKIYFAVKANGSLGILNVLRQTGIGFDAVSWGEVARCQQAGISPADVILSGVGKRDDEIASALDQGIHYICAESEQEVHAIAEIAQQTKTIAPVSLRLNPDIDPKTHPYISTGLHENKFGVTFDVGRELVRFIHDHPSLRLMALTCHIGSQVTDLAPFVEAAEKMVDLITELHEFGIRPTALGLGGGLGIPYEDETPPSPATYGEALGKLLAPTGLPLILEPGRVIMGNAGGLLTRVTRTKEHEGHRFVILDAGMNDLMRPALYQARHPLVRVHSTPERPTVTQDVVGPICESADTFARAQDGERLNTGDLVLIRGAGAYSFVMANNYNGRPRPAEVLVDGNQVHLIRERESLADMWRGERIPEASKTT